MATIPHPADKLHPQIKREIAEAFLQRWAKALEKAGKPTYSQDDIAWLAENDPDSILQKEFGGIVGESYWDRLEAHLAKVYAGKTTIISPTDRPGPRLPMPQEFFGWVPIGGPRDYPDPRFCSELEGLLAFRLYWPLWKLGIPLDFKYPVTEVDKRNAQAAEYERRKIKPLLRKSRRQAAMLAKLSNELVEAEKANPRYPVPWGEQGPDLENSHVKTFRGIGNLARFAGRLIDELPRSRRGRKKKHSKDELIRTLKTAGLSDAKIGEALWLLGQEGAGDRRERVRQCRRRMKT
jgi:hypothetical protein